MAIRNGIEIELTNGKRILVVNDWDRVYDLYEKSYSSISFTKRFPFVKIDKCLYTSFKMQEYKGMVSYDDERYKVNCSLVQLASMFGVKLKSFDRAKVEGDLEQ